MHKEIASLSKTNPWAFIQPQRPPEAVAVGPAVVGVVVVGVTTVVVPTVVVPAVPGRLQGDT